jgi:hypothetical protein
VSQTAPSTPEETEGPGLPPSLPLVLFSYLAESAGGFMVLGFVVAAATGWTTFSPLFVLGPYGLAILTTLSLVAVWGFAWSFSRRFAAKSLRLGSILSVGLSPLILSMAAVAVAVVYVTAFVVALLAVTWWELYRESALLDPSWIGTMLVDTNGATERAAPLGWLWGLGILIWWRGSYIARARVDSSGTASRFMGGLLFLLGLVVWAGIDSVGRIDASSLLAAYLLFGLAGVATARLEATVEGRAGGVDPRWRLRSLALSGLLVVLGFGLVILGLPLLVQLASWLWNWIVYGLAPALWELFMWIVRLLGMDTPPEALPEPAEKIAPPPQIADRPLSTPEWLAELARLMFNLSWIILILSAIYVAFRHRFSWRGPRRAGDPIRERMPWSLRAWLMSILLPLLRLLASRWPALTRWVSRLAAREDAAWTVRRVYSRLLAWGARRGSAREAWITPSEYALLLSSRWPGLQEDFQAITASYLEARYGGAATPEEELREVLSGWLRVEASPPEARASKTRRPEET